MNLYRIEFAATGTVVCDVYAITEGAALIVALNTLDWPAGRRRSLTARRETDVRDEVLAHAAKHVQHCQDTYCVGRELRRAYRIAHHFAREHLSQRSYFAD